ncbi:MAG: TolC family protein [Proteobacteria bacterium]|nr:TolC family protein [Pseudomonadota bacterium]NOG60848.1 TolC family protein [Pseudomonadota bacterium]
MSNNNDKTEKIRYSNLVSVKTALCSVLLCLIVILSGCFKYQYVPKPINETQSLTDILAHDPADPAFKSFLDEHQFSNLAWPIKKWDLNSLMLTAIFFNPAIKVAKSELSMTQAAEITAGQRPNPGVGIPLEHHSETGESPWLIGLVSDFLFERADKIESRQKQAISKTQAAEINLEQQVWNTYSGLHQNLIEFYAATKQKELLQQQQELLSENLSLLERRQELGQVSQFEVSSVRLELQHIQLRVSDQDYEINNAFHNLIAETGLQVDKFKKSELDFSNLDSEFNSQQFDEVSLREEVLNHRFDVRIKLKEYEALEAALRLEIVKQYPDINLSPGFIFDQGDRIWTLGAAWILPLFHNNEGQIEEALAARQHLQAEFLQLQTSLLNELNRKRQNYLDKLNSYQNTLKLMDELTNRSEQIQKQFDLGYTDSLSVVRSKIELEKARQAIFAIKIDVLRAIEQLEQVSQNALHNNIDLKTLTTRLLNNTRQTK